MPVFVGWVPNITGRLSFSRIQEVGLDSGQICNITPAPHSLLFGLQRRTSRDGPFPAWITRRMGRFPDTEYILFLRVTDGLLPYPKSNCIDVTDADHDVVLRRDTRAQLVGEIFFINGGNRLFKDEVLSATDGVRSRILQSLRPDCKPQEAGEHYDAARAGVLALWTELSKAANTHQKTPNFGRGIITLLRTGECRINIEDVDLFTTPAIKQAQAAGRESEAWKDAASDFEVERASIAEQCFFVMRDLAHKHYHHSPESDLITTAYEWSPTDDDHWRRETQYGLVRMSIAVRRVDQAKSYRQALGVIAYAEAFQRHMCGWNIGADTQLQKSNLGFDYDFSSLRASIDASLKARELDDTNRRTRLLFSFATVVTAIGILLPGLRAAKPEDLRPAAGIFMQIVATASAHPWEAVFAAALFACVMDIGVLHLSTRPYYLEAFGAGMSRLSSAFMAELRSSQTAVASHRAAMLAVLVFLLVSVSLTFGITALLAIVARAVLRALTPL